MKCEDRKVTWTTLELTGLLEDEESRVHFTRTIKHLALHPYHLNNVQRGLNQILKSSLNFYDRKLKGFVLAFRNPKLLSNLGEMFYDSPFIHIDIEVDFYLFCPIIGSLLKGIVKKKGLDHIVVLVHKIYTISIPKPDDIEEWAGDLVEIDQEVKCCVNRIDNRSRPPFICATLKSDYLQGCRLSESINNVDNMDNAIESTNSTMKIDILDNRVVEDNDISEKERKKNKKKHKKSDKTSNSLLSDDSILDEHRESHKAVKRENSIPLDSIAEIETKRRKKRAKKSREFNTDSENEEKVINTIPKCIKSEKEEHETHKKQIISNSDFSSSNVKDSASKKHKKNKKAYMKMSDSESESQVVKIKIEKQDPLIDRIINESQVSCSEIQNSNENLKTSKFVKEEISIEYDTFEEEREKSPKKHMAISKDPSKSVKIKNEDNMINDANDTSDKGRKKSLKKHANVSGDSDTEIIIKSENIKRRRKKRKESISSDSELKHPVKVKTEED